MWFPYSVLGFLGFLEFPRVFFGAPWASWEVELSRPAPSSVAEDEQTTEGGIRGRVPSLPHHRAPYKKFSLNHVAFSTPKSRVECSGVECKDPCPTNIAVGGYLEDNFPLVGTLWQVPC